MSYINFDKTQLANLEYSLHRELIRSNRSGSYASSTIIQCNTRKYHGMLVVPQPQLDGGMHVLLSQLDESIVLNDKTFNLSVLMYKGGKTNPAGHKYITDFQIAPIPITTFVVGDAIITKEMIFVTNSDSLIIKYTLVNAPSDTEMRIRPFLAYRNIHALSKCNSDVEYKYEEIPNGIRLQMYRGYSHINMQFSKNVEFIAAPDWYYNFEYFQEKDMGFDYLEDLYTPGCFNFPMKKGESIYFSASLEKENTKNFSKLFKAEVAKRVDRSSFENSLLNAAQQFIVKRGNEHKIVAGFPWFGRVARDTFISLPGLTLTQNNFKLFREVIDTIILEMKGAFFPNFGVGDKAQYNSVDGSLWFFWALQQYITFGGQSKLVWTQYGKIMKMILQEYRNGTSYNIKMQDNGLLYAGVHGKPITWMDATVEGMPVTPRTGFAVEVNALWYNAICFFVDLAKKMKDTETVKYWQPIIDGFPKAFTEKFWYEEKSYLYDYVNEDFKDISVRPNQVIATSLPFSPLTDDQKKGVLDRVHSELLTTRGLRSLAPKNVKYHSVYSGNQSERDLAYHQGSVFPWLFGHFSEAWLKLHGKSGLSMIKKYYNNFSEVMTEYGVGTIAELYDGDPPHNAGGAISQAWNVAELLRVNHIINNFNKK